MCVGGIRHTGVMVTWRAQPDCRPHPRVRWPVVVFVVLTLLVAGCSASATPSTFATPAAVPSAEPPGPTTSGSTPAAPATPPLNRSPPVPSAADSQTVSVTTVIDGDTIDTTAGRVRLAGIDTPERGECNFGPASSYLKARIAEAGNTVVLVPAGADGTDRYGRLIRYVDTRDGRDLGELMLTSGLARSRYDSRDGYGAHPREAQYIAADAVAGAPTCS